MSEAYSYVEAAPARHLHVVPDSTRVCSRCSKEKDLAAFPRADRTTVSNGGIGGVCRDCLRARSIGLTRKCRGECGQILPLGLFYLRRDGYREHTCFPCRRKHKNSLYAGDRETNPFGDLQRKLPDYDTLKRLIYSGMDCVQIGEKYGCNPSAVRATVRRRAKARGEWPLITPEEGRMRTRRGHRRKFIPGEYVVTKAILADLVREYIAEHDINYAEFARRAGLTENYIMVLCSRKEKKVAASYAVRLLETVGEPVPPQLRANAAKLRRQPGPRPKETA